MFADHVLRKQESHLVQFQVCRQTKNLLLSSIHTMSSLPRWGNQAMPQWSRASFPDLCHIYSPSSETHSVHRRKKRQGMALNDSFLPHPYCAALQCFSFLKAATTFNTEPVLFRVLPGLFSPLRAELLQDICILNPTSISMMRESQWRSGGAGGCQRKARSSLEWTLGQEMSCPQLWDPAHGTVGRGKVNKSVRGKGTWYWCPKLKDIIGT